MNIIFEEKIPLASDADIVALEKRIQHALPEAYKGFLKKYNGGYPEDDIFRYNGNDGNIGISTVRSFLNFGEGDDSIEAYLETFSDRLPDNILPIAYDGCGNLICLYFKDNSVSVVFWDHELESDTDNTFFPIAKNFETFCDNLFNEKLN